MKDKTRSPRFILNSFVIVLSFPSSFCFTPTTFLRSDISWTQSSTNCAPVYMGLGFKRRRVQNVPGNLFVDESCIDCDACRWMDPKTYLRVGLGAIVQKQPVNDEDSLTALRAMLACPTGSIRNMKGDPRVKTALKQFPFPIAPNELNGIYHLGFHTVDSGGSTPYLIAVPSQENVMIDVPRYSSRLASQIDELGGIQYLIITHKDNADGHEQWKARYPNLIRIIHSFDTLPHTRKFEMRLEDNGPWNIGEFAQFKLIYTPGHTYGSISVLFKPQKVLFTGDTIGYSWRRQRLDGWSRDNRAGMERQANSMRNLAQEDFLWLLAGRGKHMQFESTEQSRSEFIKAANIFEEAKISFS